MAKYLLIESRDSFESKGVEHGYDLAVHLAGAGNDVTLFLVQNGVLPARRGAKADALRRVFDSGVEVLGDEFSLKKRGIAHDELVAGIKAAPLDIAVDQLAEGRKAIWL